jgi:DNA replication protein DnaC
MQIENILDQMSTLKLMGMQEALREQISQPQHANLSFQDRLGLLLDREILTKENKRVKNLQKRAKLRQAASIEGICFKSKRALDKAKIMSLAKCDFIRHHHNLLITGSTGCGKTYLACAIANQACRLGFKSKYLLLPRFLEEMAISHADGSYPKLMAQLHKEDLLILDDFGLTSINAAQRHDLFNLIEDRYQLRSTIITSQCPVSKWHEYLGEPTIADAILDRISENAQRIELEGESMRKKVIDPS